jgi:tetratricopeptide (TPR) repeat protein
MKESAMTKITIAQKDDRNASPFAATVQFNDGPRYPAAVADPFSPAEEKRLRWYFEEWLIFPFTDQVKAAKAAASAVAYGERLFDQLFRANADILAEYKMAWRDGGFAGLEFEIRGTPAFHALHWEALKDPQHGRPFAVECPFWRQNDNPPPQQLQLQPAATLNVLLVTARPGGRHDVGYRTIARPLVAARQNGKLRAQIDLVRPGSYAALVRHLEESRDARGDGYYQIVHFDLHGSLLTYEQYQQAEAAVSPHFFKSGYGQKEIAPYDGYRAFLSFNGAKAGESDLVADEIIAELLQSHKIPITILNACQSGMQVGDSETSLGARLMAAGVQLALAMGYSVTVSAAELLMTQFYRQLLAGKEPQQALRQARLELYNLKTRRAAYDQRIELEDWLLPVVYQNQPVSLPIVDDPAAAAAYWEAHGARFREPPTAYGFVGRDVDILAIESRLLREEAGAADNILLIQGMGGAGKTTLLKHLAAWWQTTRLVGQVFYFGYDEKAYTAAQIMDAVATGLYGDTYLSQYAPLPDGAKLASLGQKLRSERHLLILDNLESITGAALAIQHTLNEAEQARLGDLLVELAGGRTLVLLGSRGPEEWLVGRFSKSPRYELGGLDGEAASALAQRIVTRLGQPELPASAADGPAFDKLLKLLDGYPLALEIVLANLARQSAADLLAAFSGGAAGIDAAHTPGDLWQDKTKSLLRCVEYSHSNLSPAAQTLLACLAPFTGVFNADWLPQYTAQLQAQPALADLPFDRWPELLQETVNWGLLTPHEVGGGYLRLQPILPYFLRQRLGGDDAPHGGVPETATLRQAIEAAFRVHYNEVGRALAGLIQSKQPQERQVGQALINLEYENLMTALKLALATQENVLYLYYPLSFHLGARQDHRQALALSEAVLASFDEYTPERLTGRLGAVFVGIIDDIARRQLLLKQYPAAQTSYERALALWKNLTGISEEDRGKSLAGIYHQLGRVAEEQRQWVTAESHYRQALALYIEFNDRHSQAGTYHQLGIVAQKHRQWATAESHYRQALALYIEFNDQYNQAKVYHQLGRVAQEQGQWATAESYYRQVLAIKIELNDRYSQAATYHQLGIVAQKHRQWATAESHYRQALAIYIEFNDRHGQARLYHSLGIVAQEQRQWATAESHYRQALAIYIEFNDRYKQAGTYHQLGRVAEEQGQWATAESHYRQALALFIEFNDRHSQAGTYHQLGYVAQKQRQWATAESHYRQALALFIEFNDRHSQARIYHHFGMVAEEQGQWAMAESHYRQALALKIEFNDRYSQAGTYHQLGMVAEKQEQWPAAVDYYLQAIEIYAAYPGEHYQTIAIGSLARVWAAAQKPGFSEKPGFSKPFSPGDIPGRLAAALGVTPAEAAELLTTAA